VSSQQLPSAADLEGRDLGGGRVRLRWTYPADIVAHAVTFDVFASPDPLDPFRRVVVSDLAALEVEVGGFEGGAEVFLTVVARHDGQLALPSATVRLAIAPAAQLVELTSGTARGATAGLGFPFRIDAGGGVHADAGDPLLRGKILQLLLTAPGERVNVPEFGTRLRDLVFDPGNEVLVAATEFAVARALRQFLGTEIQVEAVQAVADEAELSIDITYLRVADLRTERLRVGIPIPR
jgi:phage baseplate assembly protein W